MEIINLKQMSGSTLRKVCQLSILALFLILVQSDPICTPPLVDIDSTVDSNNDTYTVCGDSSQFDDYCIEYQVDVLLSQGQDVSSLDVYCTACKSDFFLGVVEDSGLRDSKKCINEFLEVFECPEYSGSGNNASCNCPFYEVPLQSSSLSSACADETIPNCIGYTLLADLETFTCLTCQNGSSQADAIDLATNQEIDICITPLQGQIDECLVYAIFNGKVVCYECEPQLNNVPAFEQIDFGICTTEDPITNCIRYEEDGPAPASEQPLIIIIDRIGELRRLQQIGLKCLTCSFGTLMNDFRDKCFALVKQCSNYTSGGLCLECRSGFELQGEELNSQLCKPSQDNCISFNVDTRRCEECDIGYVLQNRQCVLRVCAAGEFANEEGICERGSIFGCVIYVSEFVCQKCEEGLEPSITAEICIRVQVQTDSSSLRSEDFCPPSDNPLRRNVIIPTNNGEVCESVDINCVDDPPRVGGCVECADGRPSFRNPVSGLSICL